MQKYFQPLTYKKYLPAMFGLWFVAFAMGAWFHQSVGQFVLPAFILGLVVHGVSMHAAHKQVH